MAFWNRRLGAALAAAGGAFGRGVRSQALRHRTAPPRYWKKASSSAILAAGAAGASGLFGLSKLSEGRARCEVLSAEDIIARTFFIRLNVVPYGILGNRMFADKSVEYVAPMPNSEIVVVDSGAHNVPPPGSPNKAGGAAKVTYKWLGLSETDEFPAEVVEVVKEQGDCKFHNYGNGRQVVHAYGPDLRKIPDDAWDVAVNMLARTYAGIFTEFVDSGVPTLRLLPVSGGIFAGKYLKDMPDLTIAALRRAFLNLPRNYQARLIGRQVDLCIFMETEFEIFEDKVYAATGR